MLNNLLKKKFKITYLFNYENIFFLYLIKELFSEFKSDGLYPLVAYQKANNLNKKKNSLFLLDPILFLQKKIINKNQNFKNIIFIPNLKSLYKKIFIKKNILS